MRKSFLFMLMVAFLLLSSCGEEHRQDAPLAAAKEYYDSLLAGNYSCFVRFTYLPDTIPVSYREQLEANLRMFMARMSEEHRGIAAVSPLRCAHDSTGANGGEERDLAAEAFLELTFGDSVKEEIVVPMIRHNGVWLMR